VDDELSTDRLNRVFELQARIERETLEAYVGCVIPVLYEAQSKNDDEVCSGESEDNWTVNFTSGTRPSAGAIVPVRIVRAKHHSLFGEAVE
jgi:tRNA A37 methylthiotransferase MiaB